MNDDSNLLRAGGYSDIEIDAIAVSARRLDGTAAIVTGVFRGVIKGIDCPAAVVSVRPEIVDA